MRIHSRHTATSSPNAATKRDHLSSTLEQVAPKLEVASNEIAEDEEEKEGSLPENGE